MAADFTVDLSGLNALVTGAGTSVGRAAARALSESGAAVALSDLNIERAESIAQALQAAGGRALPLHVDISNRFQTANMIEQTRAAFGCIHILVNAAGIFKAEPMLQIDEWEWRRQIELNATGAFFCMQLVGRVMADEGGGRIINLTATAGQTHTLDSGIGYAAGAGSIIGMTRQAARELAPHDIRVNAIAAGSIRAADMPPAEPSLLKHAGTPDDIAKVVLFLSSQAADFITGQVITVDGGAF